MVFVVLALGWCDTYHARAGTLAMRSKPEMRTSILDLCDGIPCHVDVPSPVQLIQLKITSGPQLSSSWGVQLRELFGGEVPVGEANFALATLVVGTLTFASLLLLLPLLIRRLGGLPTENASGKPQKDAAPPPGLLRITGILCIGVHLSVVCF